MAKIYTETLVITLNKLLRNDQVPGEIIVTPELIKDLEAAIGSILGGGVVVEAEKV